MNREQKRALAILISMSLTLLLAIGVMMMKILDLRWLGFLLLFLVAVVPCAGAAVFFRLRPARGSVPLDERDMEIQRSAALTGYGTSSVLLMLLSFALIFILGENASIPVTWPLGAFVGAGVIYAYTFFVSLFVQYGRGGKDE